MSGADEYAAAGLNRGWFVGAASKADKSNWQHSIYATSWKKTGTRFPMVWDIDAEQVSAFNVTDRYTGGGSGGSDVFRNLDDLDFDGPLTGLDFRDWEDRLREVEEVIEIPELRNQVSEVRQSARDIRRENKENGKPPKWDLVDMQILRPMTEINKRLEQELSLRQPKRELVPVDHDPVPAQYSELVRRYYERLGGRKEKNDTRN